MVSYSDSHPDRFAVAPLVGRDHELEMLTGALRRAIEGSGSLVLVSGEAGIGKTSLVQALMAEAREQAALVLTGAAYDLSATPPYGPWIEITDRYRPDDNLPDLPDVLKRGTGISDLQSQVELFEVARAFFAAVAAARPLVLVLEDLHWADQASLDLLRYLARHVTDHPMLLIATYRDDEISRTHPLFQLIPLLVRESGARRVELRGLEAEHVTALLRTHWPLAPDDESRLTGYLLSHADGHALFTVEILRTLQQIGLLSEDTTGWRLALLDEVPVPALVQQVIERRLTNLGESARQHLEVAAVIGQQVSLDTWQAVTHMADEDLIDVVDRAVALNLLETASQRGDVNFVHALTREALYEGILPLRRRTWHRGIAETLMRMTPPDPDAVAYHFQQASDERAIEWLVRAGESAQKLHAMRVAIDRYRAAANSIENDERRIRTRGWVLFRAGALVLYNDPTESMENLNETLRIASLTADKLLYASCLIRRGNAYCFIGDVRRGIEDMANGVSAWQALTDEERKSREYARDIGHDPLLDYPFPGVFLLWLAMVGRYRECVALETEFLNGSGSADDKAEDQFDRNSTEDELVHLAMGITRAALGMPEEATPLIDRARNLFRRLRGPMESLSGMLMLRDILIPYQTDQTATRERVAAEMDDAWKRADQTLRIEMTPRLQRTHLLMHEGAWSEVIEMASRGMEWHPNRARQIELLLAKATVAYHQGDSELATEQVWKALPQGSTTQPGGTLFVESINLMQIAFEIALDDADLERARAWLEAHNEWLDWSGAVRGRAEGCLLQAKLSRAEGVLEQARTDAEQALKRASDPRQPLALIGIHRFLGELNAASEDFASAERHLRHSLDLAEACQLPFERVLSLLEIAELDLSLGNRAEARNQLTEVRSVCAELGARPSLERAERLMSRLAPRRAEDRFGLTRRELEVVEFLVHGKSDREIAEAMYISPRTVMQHVSSILRKLDVDSRTAAATHAVRHDLV